MDHENLADLIRTEFWHLVRPFEAGSLSALPTTTLSLLDIPTSFGDVPDFLGALANESIELLGVLATHYMRRRWPFAYYVAHITGLIRSEPGDPPSFLPSRIAELSSLKDWARNVHGLGAELRAVETLADSLTGLVGILGAGSYPIALDSFRHLPGVDGEPSARAAVGQLVDGATSAIELGLATITTAEGDDPRMYLMPFFVGTTTPSAAVSVSGTGGIGCVVTSTGLVPITFGQGASIAVRAGRPLGVGTNGEGTPTSRLSASFLGTEFRLSEEEIVASCFLEGGVLRVPLGEGITKHLVDAKDLPIEMDLRVDISSAHGINIQGGVGFTYTAVLNKQIGPLLLNEVTIAAGVDQDSLHGEITTSIGLDIDVLALTLKGLGVRVDLNWAGDKLTPTFKATVPTRIGLSIDAKGIGGGGFLDFDVEGGRYVGALELLLSAWELQAIAIINTKKPNGEDGFAFLGLIAAEFGPIALGWGFFLSGVGGIIGINRGINSEELLEGVRDGSLDSVMFPKDVVKNADKIISDLDRFFPFRQDNFVIAPMALIEWSQPALVRIEVAIALSIPQWTFALAGQIACTLPDKKNAIVDLQLDFAALLDVERRLFALYASLRDSTIATFPIYGDMALRIRWGADASFALSVGGFHPAFEPPNEFPELKRVGISIGFEDNPRVSVESFFAITDNSVQFGGKIYGYARFGPVWAEGEVGLQALIYFDPFRFQVDFAMAVTIGCKLGEASAKLYGTLKGPKPYAIDGEASVKIGPLNPSVRFSETFGTGSPPPAKVVALPEVLEQLREAIGNPDNWKPTESSGSSLIQHRALGKAEARSTLLPGQGLEVQQKILPLGTKITKLGTTQLDGPAQFDVICDAAGASACKEVFADFAPAQFVKMSEDARLSTAAFQSMKSGITISGSDSELGEDGDEVDAVPMKYEMKTLSVVGAGKLNLGRKAPLLVPAVQTSWVARGVASRFVAVSVEEEEVA